MQSIRPVLELLRTLALLALVALSGPGALAAAEAGGDVELWLRTAVLGALTAVFVVATLVGRITLDGLRAQRAWQLALEVVLAAALTLAPSAHLAAWLGPVLGGQDALAHAWTTPLGAVWATVAVATAMRRRAHLPSSQRSSIFT